MFVSQGYHGNVLCICDRVAMVIPRVFFPEEEAERFQSCIPVKYRTWRTPDFHSQLLSSFLDLRWTMVSFSLCDLWNGGGVGGCWKDLLGDRGQREDSCLVSLRKVDCPPETVCKRL